jgi:hypothetical protein
VSEVFPESPPSPPPATATPGQAARAAWNDHWAGPDPYPAGETQEETFERAWGDVAQAAIDAQPPSAAPELAAAMAETRAVRDGYQQLCGEFGPSAQSGWSARISLTVLNRHLRAAGLAELPRTAASGDREDITMRYRRERDEYADLLVAGNAERIALQRDRDKARKLVSVLERIAAAWTRGMYCAWIDCQRGDPAAAARTLSEGLDGWDGTEWDGTETGAEWWERTKAEEGLEADGG